MATLDKKSAKLGFVGLGLMGSRFAERLHNAGWQVAVWNRSAEPVQRLVAKEITAAGSVAELLQNVDVVLSCLANDAAVEAVYLGDAGLLAHARPEQIVIEMSTISAELSETLHAEAQKRGIRLLDVAIAGSTPAVEAGTVTLLGGGDKETFEACVPVYETLAKQWFLMGPATSGIRMKLVVNLMLGVGMNAVVEAITLGLDLKLDRETLLDALSKTAVVPPAMVGKFKKIKDENYEPEFPLQWMSKDMNLVGAVADKDGLNLPVAKAAQETFAKYVASAGDLDLSAIAKK